MPDTSATAKPDAKSSDYSAMLPYWQMIEAILGGADTMRAAGETYLPKFENESRADYDHRKRAAPFTNLYADISQSLASKPFGRELSLKKPPKLVTPPPPVVAPLTVVGAPPVTPKPAPDQDADDPIATLCEDIDGQGNNLHVFASNYFQRAIDKAVDWIFVDHTKTMAPEGRTLSVAEEREQGARPYWVHVPAENLLAVYSDRVNGTEVFVHARIYEPATIRDGFGEKTVERVRVLDRQPLAVDADGIANGYGPATYEVYEKTPGKPADGYGGAATDDTWASIEGPSPLTIGIIPLVPFVTGKRIGSSWCIRPALRDIAHLQIEEFQQESNLKSVLELTCYPMLAGNGVAKPVDAQGQDIRVPVGPRGVLFAPPDNTGKSGSWSFIEPGAASITALQAHLEATQKNMRDLGMQPLTTANLTVITTANVSMKAHSVIQAWALKLKDALEQALKYTAMWMGDESKAPEVDVFQDFGVDLEAGNEVDSLIKMQAANALSKRTLQEELRRRGVLSDNFDTDEEQARIAFEEQGLEPEEAIDPATGQRVNPPTKPLVLTKPDPVTETAALAANDRRQLANADA